MDGAALMRLWLWTHAMRLVTRLWLFAWKHWAAADGEVRYEGDDIDRRGLMQ
jgi:hypothetical protein